MHFEEIWEEAERVGSFLTEDSQLNIINNIESSLKLYVAESNKDAKIQNIGEIIYYICQLTRLEDINSAQALFDAINSRSINAT